MHFDSRSKPSSAKAHSSKSRGKQTTPHNRLLHYAPDHPTYRQQVNHTEGPLISGRLVTKAVKHGQLSFIIPSNKNPKRNNYCDSEQDRRHQLIDSKGRKSSSKPNSVKSTKKDFKKQGSSAQIQRKDKQSFELKSEEKLKTFHQTEAHLQARKEYEPSSNPFQFHTQHTGIREKLPVNILQELEWIKADQHLGSRTNQAQQTNNIGAKANSHIGKLSFLDSYEHLSTQFGKSVTLSKKIESCTNSIERQREEWPDSLELPLTSKEAAQRFGHYLTRYEKQEIRDFDEIYYLGHKVKKTENIAVPGYELTHSFDNQDQQYKYTLHDHIAYRYQIIEYLGKGSYGQVFKAFDHKNKEHVALKIIKNKKKFTKQGEIELNLLLDIRQHDEKGISGVVKIKDFAKFREHLCLIFELLSDNLYELIKKNDYNGLDTDLIRRFAIQILYSLKFLRKRRIIHCDLKPENILLKQPKKSGIKLIDFGSSCYEDQIIYSYIQSRYYRAPEVTLGVMYGPMIDMWSFGCILAELYLGAPLFPGDNEREQMYYMISCLGEPPAPFLKNAKRRKMFFNDDLTIRSEVLNSKITPGFGRPLKQLIDPQDRLFLEFLETILQWEPTKRLTPQQALKSEWIRQGLPEEIRNAHKLYSDHPEEDLQKQKRSSKLHMESNASREIKRKKDLPTGTTTIGQAHSTITSNNVSTVIPAEKSKSHKSKSRSRENSIRIKEPLKGSEEVKIKLDVEAKLKRTDPRINIQIQRTKKSRDFFKQK